MSSSEQIFICLAVPLCISLVLARAGARRFCAFLLAGMSVCLLAAYINSFLVSALDYTVTDAAIYITPISEELMKLMPLLFYVLVFDPDDDRLMTAALAIGVGFAIFENCCYVAATPQVTIVDTFVRGFAVGIMHIVCTLAAGLVFVLFRRVRGLTGLTIMGLISLIVTYHALYNLLVSVEGVPRTIGYILPLLTLVAILVWRHRKVGESPRVS